MNRLLCAVAVLVVACPVSAQDSEPAEELRPVEIVRNEASSLHDLAETDLGRAFYDAAERLPEIDDVRVAYFNRSTREALSETDALALPDEQREEFTRYDLSEHFYYNTFYGSPVAYGRAIDLAGRHGVNSAESLRVFDYGFGGIGHLRMLASLGAHAVGVEVLELLDIYYSDEDTGIIQNDDAPDGSIKLLYGSFPGDETIVNEAGSGFHIFMSKNTLKSGYIHPEREVDDRFLVHLGVDDETYLRAVHKALRPDGLMIVYNLYPKQNPEGERYLPWATGDFPFAQDLCEKLGFEIVEWNVNDDEYAREMGARLGWGEPEELEETLFATYTILRRE